MSVQWLLESAKVGRSADEHLFLPKGLNTFDDTAQNDETKRLLPSALFYRKYNHVRVLFDIFSVLLLTSPR